MTDELFINGERADLGDSGVFLSYESGVLSSLDTVAANYSYSIKLPATAVNRRLCGALLFPTTATAFPAVRNAATLCRDGVVIVDGADLNLLEVDDDTIKVSISWGVDNMLAGIADLSLADLFGDETFPWGSGGGGTAEYGADRGAGAYMQPVLDVADIMTRLNARCGGIIDYTLDDDYVIPILLRTRYAPLAEVAELTAGALTPREETAVGYSSPAFHFTLFNVAATGDVTLSPTVDAGQPFGFFIPYGSSYTVRVSLTVLYTLTGGAIPPLAVGWGSRDNSGAEIQTVTPLRLFTPERLYDEGSGDLQRVYRYAGDVVITNDEYLSTARGYYIGFSLYNSGTEVSQSVLPYGDDEAPHIIVTPYNEEEDEEYAVPGDTLRYADNVPNISCRDLLKGLCGVLGWYVQRVGTRVALVPYSTLVARGYGVADWSRYLLATDDVPPALVLSPDGAARVNRFKYSNSDDIDDWEEVRVDNYALDEATDFMSLAVCGTAPGGTEIANIPIYSLVNPDDDDDDDDEDEPSPTATQQVWEYTEDEGCYILRRAGGFLYRLPIATAGIAALLQGRVVTVYMALDAPTLRDLDLRRAVYLSTFGCYFVVQTIKTKQEYCEVQLLTLM